MRHNLGPRPLIVVGTSGGHLHIMVGTYNAKRGGHLQNDGGQYSNPGGLFIRGGLVGKAQANATQGPPGTAGT